MRSLVVFTLCAFTAAAFAQDDDPGDKKGVIPDGLKALKHPDAAVRYEAALLLARLGPTAKFAVAELRETLKDANGYVRVKAAEALWKIDKTSPMVLLPVLLQALKEKEPQLRAAAAPVIGMLGAKAKSAAPALIAALDDKDDRVRGQAAAALGDIGPAAKEAAPALLKLIKDGDFSFLEPIVVTALGNMGPGVVDVLAKALTGDSVQRRRVAADALALLGPQATEALPALTSALADKDAGVRASAVKALGGLGEAGKPALAKLPAALKDADPEVRLAAAYAIWQLSGKVDQLAVLEGALKSPSKYVRLDVCQIAGKIGPAAKDSAGALKLVLTDKESEVRQAAAQALGAFGAASQAGAELQKLFKDEEPLVRLAAALAHWRVTGKAEPALGLFRLTLKQEDPFVRRQAIVLLGDMGQAAEPLFTVLIEMLPDEEPALRADIKTTLKKINPEAAKKAGIR